MTMKDRLVKKQEEFYTKHGIRGIGWALGPKEYSELLVDLRFELLDKYSDKYVEETMKNLDLIQVDGFLAMNSMRPGIELLFGPRDSSYILGLAALTDVPRVVSLAKEEHHEEKRNDV